MGYKSIRIVGVISALLSAALLGAQLLAAMGADPPAIMEASGLWLAFLLVSILASCVGPILEVQSIQIANLQRQLAERK